MQEHTESHKHFGGTSDSESPVDICELRTEVQSKYAAVATDPEADYHFHTGRSVAERCRYDLEAVDALPSEAVESFAGVANPFELRDLKPGERVLDLGSGAGTDSFLAAAVVGETGYVTGIDMTEAMLTKSRATMASLGLGHRMEFCHGYIEDLPIADGWADVVIANGVINLCPDKSAAMAEAWRVLRPGGAIQFADIANGQPVPEEARRHIDLWTG